eukprot:scaffold117026_cov33-Tisochrysis_lutea.AAC.2
MCARLLSSGGGEVRLEFLRAPWQVRAFELLCIEIHTYSHRQASIVAAITGCTGVSAVLPAQCRRPRLTRSTDGVRRTLCCEQGCAPVPPGQMARRSCQ